MSERSHSRPLVVSNTPILYPSSFLSSCHHQVVDPLGYILTSPIIPFKTTSLTSLSRSNQSLLSLQTTVRTSARSPGAVDPAYVCGVHPHAPVGRCNKSSGEVGEHKSTPVKEHEVTSVMVGGLRDHALVRESAFISVYPSFRRT